MRRLLVVVPLALLISVALRGTAGASLVCMPVEAGTIQLDGLLGDWRGTARLRVDRAAQLRQGRGHWSGAADLSFEARCNHDRKHLFIAVRVFDDYFVRSPKATGDDHLRLRFGRRVLQVRAGDLRTIASRASWGRKRAQGVSVAEAMQTNGYSVELRIPLRQLPGYRPGVPAIPLQLEAADCDSKARRRIESVIGTGPTQLSFGQQQADLAAFLDDKGYAPRQIRSRQSANVVGDRRLEQVLLVGRTIGVLGDGLPSGRYFYLDLPVSSAADVRWLRLLDLDGDRRAEMVVRYVERARNGRRELLAIYRFDSSDQPVRPLAHEVLKAQAGRVLENRVTFKPRRIKGGRRGHDIVIDQPTTSGFTAENYRDAEARDAYPALTPWGEVQKRAFRFDGDEFSEL